MPRILFPAGPVWYDGLRSVSFYGESELEREIRQHVTSLFPDFFVFPFKRDVVSKVTGLVKRPDLGIVRKDFKAWGVIEVETDDHDLPHVLEQVQCFASGDYNAPELAEYVRKQLAQHCRIRSGLARLRGLFTSEPPTVLVLVDADKEGWRKELEASGGELCTFEIYRSSRGINAYRLAGKYPVFPAMEAPCRRHPALANTLEVVGAFHFRRVPKSRSISVAIDAYVTRWGLVEDAGRTYLRFLGKSNPLSPNRDYYLVSDRRGKYYFRTS